MPLTSELSAIVRREIAACVGADISDVTPDARFLQDLGATFEQLKPLRLQIEQALGISIEPIVADINAMTAVDTKGCLTVESAAQLRDYLPDLWVPFDDIRLPDLFTVQMIEAMVAKAIAERDATDGTSAARLTAKQSATLRTLIARRGRVAADQLTPATTLFRDLKLDGTQLALLVSGITTEFDSDILPLLTSIQSRLKFDGSGKLTAESLKNLRPLLPMYDFDAAGPKSFDDLVTVQLVEDLVAQLLAKRPADLPFQPITSFEWQDWIRQLPDQLGERKLRLLVSAASRLSFRNAHTIEPDVIQAWEALEKFADTGKSKSVLKEFQKGYWEWSKSRDAKYVGLHHAMTPTDPDLAVTPVTTAIQSGLQMRNVEALRELLRLHTDLVSPLGPDEFAAAWRSPDVVALARSMYDARNFSQMPQLADQFEKAGCSNRTVLDHCRQSGTTHIRGCWVIDAILDGSWATEVKPAKAVSKSTTAAKPGKSASAKSLLSQLPKRSQIEISTLMSNTFNQVPIETFLTNGFCASLQDLIQRYGEDEIDERLLSLDLERPELNRDQQVSVASVQSLYYDAGAAIARRITLEDPAELARGLFVDNRLTWLQGGCRTGSSEQVLSIFAVRDLKLVGWLAEHAGPVETDYPNDEEPLCLEVAMALLKRDSAAVKPVVDRMRRKKAKSWMQHKFASLLGIADRNAQQVADGLKGMLELYPKRRDEDASWEFNVFNVEVHGLYRLAEWISPELASAFDVTQAFPWDAGFHAWTQTHENAIEQVDFSGVAPLLRDVVQELKYPAWWIQSPQDAEAAERHKAEMCKLGEVWVLDLGHDPQAVQEIIARIGQKPPKEYPALVTRCMRYAARFWQLKIEKAGGTVEIR